MAGYSITNEQALPVPDAGHNYLLQSSITLRSSGVEFVIGCDTRQHRMLKASHA